MSAHAGLARVAVALGELTDRLVFVGGATVDLFMTDPGVGPARFTEDVDAIVSVRSRVEFHEQVEKVLRAKGFKEDTREDAPVCRWVRSELTLDVMPTDSNVLGFTNRWYEEGVATAVAIALESGTRVRILTAPTFVATKFEAFKGRGANDFLGSADIEDIVRVLDGREELYVEVQKTSGPLRTYLRDEFARLLETEDFLDALPGHLPGDAASQARVPLILRRIRELARL